MPHIAACINSSTNETSEKSPYYTVCGVDKGLPYDLLANPQKLVYNIENYDKQCMHIFTDIHAKARSRLQSSRAEVMVKVHKNAVPVTFKVGDNVIIRLPEKKFNT